MILFYAGFLAPTLALRIKSSEMNDLIYELLTKGITQVKSSDSLTALWKDLYDVGVKRVENAPDQIIVTLYIRLRQGIQKLAQDCNGGTFKKNLITKLLRLCPETKSKAEKLTVNFDLKEYESTCGKLKEIEQEEESVAADGQPSASSMKSVPAKSGFEAETASSPYPDQPTHTVPQTKPQTLPVGRGAESEINVLKGVLFNMITNTKYNSYDFETHLKKLTGNQRRLSSIYNDDGYSLLHQIVISVRQTFLGVLFRNGYWSELIHVTARGNQNTQWAGKTAKDICENRSRSRKLLAEVQHLTAWEKSLQDVHLAARAGKEKKLKTLLHKDRSSLEVKDNAGATPLYWAAVSGNVSNVKYLLQKNADPTVTTDRGETPLLMATAMGHPEVITALLTTCSTLNPNTKDIYKKSAWLRNAERGDIDTLKVTYD